MKIVSINGSPKGRESNTQVMLDALLKGFASNQTESINITLSEKNINYCRGCYSCWFKTPGLCVIADDMKQILETMKAVDLFIFGTPLFFNNISGTLKVFFDRLTAAGGNPHKEVNPQGSKPQPRMILVSNCGFPYRIQFDVVSLWIKNVARMMQFTLIGEFYTTQGKVLTQPAAEQTQSRARYLAYLENCGKQYLENKSLTEEQIKLQDKNVLDF